jgi:protein-S-isoprenylcysteine O-methyltransferase Ste14
VSLIWIALAWLAYAALHSLLASLAIKHWVARRWPALMPAYRLAFNAFAALALLPVLWLVYGTESEWLWRWTGAGAWLANGLALTAIAGFAVTARAYDMDEFLGLRQWRQRDRGTDDREPFALSAVHRHVRHPWYFFGLLLVWTRDMNGPLLISALAITAYFVIGSWLEDRKLAALHGATFRRYRDRVPGLVPLPWKFLTAEQARELMQRPGHG